MAEHEGIVQDSSDRTLEKVRATKNVIEVVTGNPPRDYEHIYDVQTLIEQFPHPNGSTTSSQIHSATPVGCGDVWQKLTDWYQLTTAEQRSTRNFLTERFSVDDLELAYNEYYPRFGQLPSVHDFRVFILNWEAQMKADLEVKDTNIEQLANRENNLKIALDFAVNNSVSQQEQIDTLVRENGVLQEEVDQVTTAKDQLCQSNRQLVQENRQLSDDKNYVERFLAQQKRVNSHLRRDVEQQKTVCSELKTKNKQLCKNNNDLKTENVNLMAENTQKDDTISTLQTENTQLHTENTQKDDTISTLQTENTQKDDTISTLQTENTHKDDTISTLQTENTQLHTENTQKDDTISTLQTENTQLHTENTQKDDTISTLQTENTQKDDTISTLQTENTHKDDTISTLQTENTQKDDTISTLQTENKYKEKKNSNLKKDNVLLRQRLQETIDLCEHKNRKIRKQEIKVDELQHQISVASDRISVLEKDNQDYFRKNMHQAEHINAQEKTISDLSTRLQEQEDINKDLYSQINELRQLVLQQLEAAEN